MRKIIFLFSLLIILAFSMFIHADAEVEQLLLPSFRIQTKSKEQTLFEIISRASNNKLISSLSPYQVSERIYVLTFELPMIEGCGYGQSVYVELNLFILEGDIIIRNSFISGGFNNTDGCSETFLSNTITFLHKLLGMKE